MRHLGCSRATELKMPAEVRALPHSSARGASVSSRWVVSCTQASLPARWPASDQKVAARTLNATGQSRVTLSLR